MERVKRQEQHSKEEEDWHRAQRRVAAEAMEAVAVAAAATSYLRG